MKSILMFITTTGFALADVTDDFIQSAKERHGACGERAADFLIKHMPQTDRHQLSEAFLNENLNLAFKARESFPWAKSIPEEVFFNDVLPYAVFDEPRDPWRSEFMRLATPIVKGSKTTSEATQALNKQFFNAIDVHYHTERKRTNQSPKESIEQGRATCTGLSIILVNACRAVGIPARAVGTPMWSNGRGNHTWVEIYDDGEWHFTGADEYTEEGLNRGWFTGDAAKADASKPMNAIYATSWKRDDLHFPMVWAPYKKTVAAINVSHRYTQSVAQVNHLGIRLFGTADRGSRILARGSLLDSSGHRIGDDFSTKAGTTDLNDMPRIEVTPGETYRLGFIIGGKTHQTDPFVAREGETTMDVRVADLHLVKTEGSLNESLTEAQAATATREIYLELLQKDKAERTKELEKKVIALGDHTLKWKERTFGKTPKDGPSLWISMHGGGSAPAAVNDQQWNNQVELYEPEEGIYVAPRAPTDTWNMWHQAHIDPLFSRLIENVIALRGVNPDKVYLLGYSAGGDGVWQLAPRMADRFAAASMMAGHPNESKLLGLRNLPFGIFMGGNDRAYKRNNIAAEKTAAIEKLRKADPDGYEHMSRIYEGLPHWMNRKDAEAIPWMAKFTRKTWPDRLVWFQDDVTHNRYYWIEIPAGSAKAGQQIIASARNNQIRLKGEVPEGTRLLLHDDFVDIDQPVMVSINGERAKTYQARRSAEAIRHGLEGRLDPNATPTAMITLK